MFEEWYLNELFSTKIRKIWKVTDYYLLQCIFNILKECEIIELLTIPITIKEIISKKGYPEKTASSLEWILDRLALDGYIEIKNEENEKKYKLSNKKIDYNLEELKEKALTEDKTTLSTFKMLDLMSKYYPKYLKGEKSGVDILFSPENIETTDEYYKNNLFYNVHNIAGAKIVNYDIENRNNPVTILEIGGGLGGGTVEFIKQRVNSNKKIDIKYYFTDVSNKMLRVVKKEFSKLINDSNFSIEYKKFDFNIPIEEQGFSPNSVDVVWGVNAIHVAYDLRFTLKEIFRLLKDNGSLIVSETVRAIGNKMIQQELILNTLDDYWNVKIDKDIRPIHGFMEWSNWVNALKAAGYSDVKTIPDMKYLESQYDNCYVAVIRGLKNH